MHLREVISGFATILQTHPNTPRSFITIHVQDIENDFNLIMRHYTFVYLFNCIVSRVGVLDFKSQKALINNLKKDHIISPTLRKIDEAFKILFEYFQLEDKTFLSYLEDENRNRFKFHLNEQISIEKVKENPPSEAQLRIIKNDQSLANLKIKVNNVESYYSAIQTGIANLYAFDEKPKFYREVESFDNFQ